VNIAMTVAAFLECQLPSFLIRFVALLAANICMLSAKRETRSIMVELRSTDVVPAVVVVTFFTCGTQFTVVDVPVTCIT
jgi:hypothetical protein